jgi:hypothetical protein
VGPGSKHSTPIALRKAAKKTMSMETTVAVGLVVLFMVMMLRQRSVYTTYQRAQQQVLDRQAETMALQRESLDAQKEMVRLLTMIASRQ